ncbi:flagellar hook-length control protein FliK [Rhodopseudomonas telluris]|uniref:Flagellar hook-length control protein FliK n=1 Tax=Rhodopseudomonas telluris TaxID=644215 RepID=A0ABV6EZ24_9BRAD
MAISVNPNLPLVALQGVTADVTLQPGTVVQAKVLAILDNSQVRIAIGGQTVEATTQVPLQAGQTLQVAVSQSDQGVRLAIVNQPVTTNAPANLAAASLALDTVTLAPQAITLTAQAAPSLVPAANALTPQQVAALTTAAQTAATQQTGLSSLFANLDAVTDLASLPQAARQAVAQVQSLRTALTPALTGADIQRAVQSSGIFLEASLASAQPATAGTDLKAALIVLRQVLSTALGGSAAANAGATAMPTPLLQNGQLLAQTTLLAAQSDLLGTTTETATQTTAPFVAADRATTSPTLASMTAATGASATDTAEQALLRSVINQLTSVDASATTATRAATTAAGTAETLSALQEAVQANPQTAAMLAKTGFAGNALLLSLLPAASGARIGKMDDNAVARTNTPPPPIGGALPAAQAVMPASLEPHTPLDSALRRVLTETEGSLARQTLLQVASLPDRLDGASARLDALQPRWSFEIPFTTPQGTAVAQFEISRDGDDAQTGTAANRVWRARFSLDVEPAGPVHALISLQGEKTSVRMWAERPSTAAQLRAGANQLTAALSRADLNPGDIIIREGAPSAPPPASAGHFLDRAL